jgi:hypothetical protein
MSGGGKRSFDDEVDALLAGGDGFDNEVDNLLRASGENLGKTQGRVPKANEVNQVTYLTQDAPPEPAHAPSPNGDPLIDDPLPSYGTGVNTGAPAPEEERPSFLRGLTEAILGSSPGAVLNAAAKNKPAMAAAAGLQNGVTMGLTQNMPGYRDFAEEQRSGAPAAYKAGDMAGAFLNPINEVGAGLKGAAGLARGAAQGFVQGATKNWSESDPEQPVTDRVINALTTGGQDAIGALAIDSVARGMGSTADAAAGLSHDIYNRARLGAAQVPAKVLDSFAVKRDLPNGRAAGNALVAENERLAPPNWIFPRNPDDIVEQYKMPLDDANAAINYDMMRAQAAGARLPPDPRLTAAQGLAQKGHAAEVSGGVNNEMAQPLFAARRQAMMGPNFRDPFALRDQRIKLDQAVFDTPNKGSPEDLASQAKLELANQYRGMGYDYAEQAGPDIAADYDAHNRAYEALSSFSGSARQASMSAATGGARAAGDSMGGNLWRAMGRIPGMDYAPDMIGNMAKPTTEAFSGLGSAADWLSKSSGAAAQPGVDVVQALMGGGKASAQDTNVQQVPNTSSRGDLAPQQYNDLFMKHQDAFQPWADKFAAIGDIDTNDDAFTAKFEYLYRTDPEFTRRVDMLTGDSYAR